VIANLAIPDTHAVSAAVLHIDLAERPHIAAKSQ